MPRHRPALTTPPHLMTVPNRVDELRKRYHENPRRFFAALANEYRKTGFVDRAILLCEKHLGEQPGNMNGLVVYGQCLFETGRLDEARGPFEMALGLDPENLIALRHLGDIARLAGDHETAKGWYQRLLEFDRRNDEVLELLAQIGGEQEKPPARLTQAPSIISVASSVSIAGVADGLASAELAEAPGVESVRAPSVAAPTPARQVTPQAPVAVRTARVATPVDPAAKTVEVSARSVPPLASPPAGGHSLLDVSFDFGDIGEAAAPAPPPAPLLPSEPAEYGFAAPAPEISFDDALEALGEPEPAPLASDPDAPLSLTPLVEASSEGEPLGELAPIEGLLPAEFNADVVPLADLESTEFEGGEAAPLAELEPREFEPPSRESVAIEGFVPAEFTPPSFAAISAARLSSDVELIGEDAFGLSTSEAPGPPPGASPADDLAWPADLGSVDGGDEEVTSGSVASSVPESRPDALPDLAPELEPEPEPVREEARAPRDMRASVAGLPLLTPLGTPTPLATPAVDHLAALPSLEDAETLQVDVETLRRRMEMPPTIVTETMAQVYVEQGHTDKAIAVYQQLVARSPDDAQLRARLRALETPAPAPANAPTPEVSRPSRPSLGFDTPLSAEPVGEAPPADAMLSAMSFEGLSLSTPATPARRPTPAETSAPALSATGPSAREFFAQFVRRAVSPVPNPAFPGGAAAGGALLSPLDEVFPGGVRPEDEAAAHRLAGVGATSGPSGGSELDSLFGEGPSAPAPTTTPARGGVTRASQTLRFDQFFASSTPVESAAAPASPESARPKDADQEDAGEEPGEDDDLDQFQGWLRGLTS